VNEPDVNEPDVNEPDVNEPDVNEPDVNELDVNEPDLHGSGFVCGAAVAGWSVAARQWNVGRGTRRGGSCALAVVGGDGWVARWCSVFAGGCRGGVGVARPPCVCP
jgi:hypothetical protein